MTEGNINRNIKYDIGDTIHPRYNPDESYIVKAIEIHYDLLVYRVQGKNSALFLVEPKGNKINKIITLPYKFSETLIVDGIRYNIAYYILYKTITEVVIYRIDDEGMWDSRVVNINRIKQSENINTSIKIKPINNINLV